MARPTRTLTLLAACALLWCGSAVAAPPTDPPGKSGSAPGHQKHADDPSPPQASPPAAEPVASASIPADEPEAKDKHAAPPATAAEPSRKQDEPKKKPEQQKAKAGQQNGKPGEQDKDNERQTKPERPAGSGPAPAAAVSITPPPPATSISAPGSSGPHKVTICHNGHAITVDAHGARTHVERHGDTYAPAGAKGRAGCAKPVRNDDPPTRNDVPTTTDVPKTPGVGVATTATAAAADPTPVPAATVEEARPDGVRPTAARSSAAAHGVLAQTRAVERGTLPFTGRSLPALVLLGLALVALGTLLRRSQRSVS